MANKITTVIDFVTTGAQRSVKTFRQSISEADGAVGKFKAGASSAMSAVSANLGNLALAGGAAAVALGTKVVAAFQETALEAGKLADATGLTVEAASRLREVSADLGVSGETVTMIVKKLTVELGKGNPLLEQYGIALQRGSDGAADINATLIDTIRRIQAIEDPTKRAAAAQAAFGRGFADAAELIGTNADELQAKLDSVSNAKVITEDELANAREFRDTMEELKDVGEDLATTSGQALVPALTDLAEVLLAIEAAAAKAKAAIESAPGGKSFLDTAFSGIPDIVDDFKTNARNLGEGLGIIDEKGPAARQEIDRFADSVLNAGTVAADAESPVDDLAEEVVDLGDKAANSGPKIGDMAGVLADLPTDAEKAAEALGLVAEAAAAVGDAVDDAFADFDDDLDQLDRIDDIEKDFKNLGETGEEGVRQVRREIGRFLRDLDDIPPDKKVEILAELRNADIEGLRRILDDLTKDRFINIGIAGATNPGFTSGNVAFNPAAGTITPTFQGVQTAIPSQNITVIYPVGTTPTTQFVNGQIDAQRNGTRNPNLQ